MHAEVGDRLGGAETPTCVMGVHDLEPDRRPFDTVRQRIDGWLVTRYGRAELEHDFRFEPRRNHAGK